MPAVTAPSHRATTTATVAAAVALALFAGACGRGDDPSVHAGVDVAPVTTTAPLDDDSDLPPIPVPIDPASIPPGPRLIGMDPAHLATFGFVLLDPVGVPKIGKDLAAVLGLHQAGEGTVTDVVLAKVTNGQGVGSCELCWVVSVKGAPRPATGPGPGPDGSRVPRTGPPVQPKVYYFVLIDAMTGGFITGWA